MSTFTEAWAGLKRGEKWRRKSWDVGEFWLLDHHLLWWHGGDTRAEIRPDDIDATDWERVDERPTMDWAGACKALLDRKVVERGFIRIRLDTEDELIQDDEDGAPYLVSRSDLEATDWRKVKA